MKTPQINFAHEKSFAKLLCGDLPQSLLENLEALTRQHKISLIHGDIRYLNGGWYVTHSGLLRLAERHRCAGIHVRPVIRSCVSQNSRWIFRATVFKSRTCKGFVGYGDAGPSNVSPSVHGAEM